MTKANGMSGMLGATRVQKESTEATNTGRSEKILDS